MQWSAGGDSNPSAMPNIGRIKAVSSKKNILLTRLIRVVVGMFMSHEFSKQCQKFDECVW